MMVQPLPVIGLDGQLYMSHDQSLFDYNEQHHPSYVAAGK